MISNEDSNSVNTLMRPVRVFIVDDSPLLCKAIEKMLQDDPEIEIVGHAMSGQEALNLLPKVDCDICTLDVHMPGMSGITTLKHIMIRFPVPVLMLSAFTAEGSRITFEALRYGAVDFFQKPSRSDTGEADSILAQANILKSRLKRAARVRLDAARYLRLKVRPRELAAACHAKEKGIVVMGATTGGYASLLSLLPNLGAPPATPVLIFLGVAPQYVGPFAEYLKAYLPCPVVRGINDSRLQAGSIYLVSMSESARLEYRGDDTYLLLNDRSELMGMESGLDLLLYSVSEHFGPRGMVAFLSGDGTEGLEGARELARCGGMVLAQTPDTCLVPELAEAAGRIENAKICSLAELSSFIVSWQC